MTLSTTHVLCAEHCGKTNCVFLAFQLFLYDKDGRVDRNMSVERSSSQCQTSHQLLLCLNIVADEIDSCGTTYAEFHCWRQEEPTSDNVKTKQHIIKVILLNIDRNQ